MSIENLTKYYCVYSPTKNFNPMILSESPLGEYVKFEEAMEASSNRHSTRWPNRWLQVLPNHFIGGDL